MKHGRFAITVSLDSHIKIWKIAREFASEIYEITRNFPKDELFGLTSQLRRAAVSVSSNIAKNPKIFCHTFWPIGQKKLR